MTCLPHIGLLESNNLDSCSQFDDSLSMFRQRFCENRVENFDGPSSRGWGSAGQQVKDERMSIWWVKTLKSVVHYGDSQFLSSIGSIFTLSRGQSYEMRIKTSDRRRGAAGQIHWQERIGNACYPFTMRTKSALLPRPSRFPIVNLKCDCYA
jgi:hypothetical protein